MAKMLRAKKQFGRCDVKGHGDKCEVSHDIQTIPMTRSQDKREWKQEVKNDTPQT